MNNFPTLLLAIDTISQSAPALLQYDLAVIVLDALEVGLSLGNRSGVHGHLLLTFRREAGDHVSFPGAVRLNRALDFERALGNL